MLWRGKGRESGCPFPRASMSPSARSSVCIHHDKPEGPVEASDACVFDTERNGLLPMSAHSSHTGVTDTEGRLILSRLCTSWHDCS